MVSVLHPSPNEFHLGLYDAQQSMRTRATNVHYRTVQQSMRTESDLVYVPFVQNDLPKIQKGLGILIGAITVAHNSNPKYVANSAEHIVFGADLKGNDAKAVETWYLRFAQLTSDTKYQIDEQKIASKCSVGR